MNLASFSRTLYLIAFSFALFLAGCLHQQKKQTGVFAPRNAVGRIAENRHVTPTGQLLTPAGMQVELPGMRPQALAQSPDGKLLVTAGKSFAMVVINPANGKILQHVSLSTNKVEVKPETGDPTSDDPAANTDDGNTSSSSSSSTSSSGSRTNRNAPPPTSAQMSFNGLVFSPDGKRIYLSIVGGGIRAFPVSAKHIVGSPVNIVVPEIENTRQRRDIPTGIAVSDDSKKIYVLGSVIGLLYELDALSGKELRSWEVGVAPYEVVVVGTKAYVSNLGGRWPGTNDLTAPSGRNTRVRVDPVRHIANEGSVSVVDLVSGNVKTEIITGLHASALAVSPNKKYVVVANTGSDTLSVIDTKTDAVVEKISARQNPGDLFGAQPNALTFDSSGKLLYVCNGTQNAVAVMQFEPEDNASRVIGLVPVGWFPGAVQYNATYHTLCVANIKGEGVRKDFKPGERVKLATKDFYGTVSLIPAPAKKTLASMTRTALLNMRYPKLQEAALPPRPNQPPRPVPERVGEPSVFKHVIYVIKENRTYDQVLGDMPEGNGDTNLCTFGERFTPNQHKIAREFILLDNTYCAGVQSADGHQWTDSGIANEYVERQLTAGFPRSYPGAKEEAGIDALAWSSSGFIWDNALAHGKSFRNYGEWMITTANWKTTSGRRSISWTDFWKDYTTGTNQTRLTSKPGIETLRKYSNTNTVGWDLKVPDVMRAAEFIKELKQFEATGTFPDFVMLFLPNDHTGGTRGRYPIPGAQVADNDLAFGHIVEALTHSKFWTNTCLIAIEDDPQAGWDHVSGYRTTCYVVSPYTKRKKTISTQYNQTSLLRTMELILGLPPMNQMDATATPMTECFMSKPDFTPFVSVPNRVPLDQLNPEPRRIANPILRRDAIVSASLPLDEMDKCPEDVFNRIIWRAMKGPDVPYPEWAVKLVDDDD